MTRQATEFRGLRRALGVFGLNLYALALFQLIGIGYLTWSGRVTLQTRALVFLLAGDLVLTVGAVLLIRSVWARSEDVGWRLLGVGAVVFGVGLFLLAFA
jgi:hypothetical protein